MLSDNDKQLHGAYGALRPGGREQLDSRNKGRVSAFPSFARSAMARPGTRRLATQARPSRRSLCVTPDSPEDGACCVWHPRQSEPGHGSHPCLSRLANPAQSGQPGRVGRLAQKGDGALKAGLRPFPALPLLHPTRCLTLSWSEWPDFLLMNNLLA